MVDRIFILFFKCLIFSLLLLVFVSAVCRFSTCCFAKLMRLHGVFNFYGFFVLQSEFFFVIKLIFMTFCANCHILDELDDE